MIRAPRTQRSRRGDTLIEVLIATAVVAALLGGAYATISKSTEDTQAAQERSEALGIAQAQVEALPQAIAYAANTAGAPNPAANPSIAYCIDVTGQFASGTFAAFNNGGVFSSDTTKPAPPIADYPDGSNNSAKCQGLGTGGLFRVGLQYFPNGASSFYRVYVDWDSATGVGQDQVTLSYKPQ